MLKVGVVGASGYAGIQLVAILAKHPKFELCVVCSDENAGKSICDVYPSFINLSLEQMKFVKNDSELLYDLDIVFLAVPHTKALLIAPKLIERGVNVIDLSADFRFENKDIYENWYGIKHTQKDLLKIRKKGLPELYAKDMKKAYSSFIKKETFLISCAGCYVTASCLAAKPFVASKFFDSNYMPVIDAISGFTGAGKNPGAKGLFVNSSENASVYGVTKHRHTPEIEQILGSKVVFTPHLAPLKRGILSTVTMKIKDGEELSCENLKNLYDDFYENAEFVKVLECGQFPQTAHVVGTNFAHIGLAVDQDKKVVVVICAIDNLIKGAAGQAVQCANLACGCEEDEGLGSIFLPV